jgi:hypothetical protein
MRDAFGVEQSKAFATGLFQGAEIVFEYMKDRYSLIARLKVNLKRGTRRDVLSAFGSGLIFGCKP